MSEQENGSREEPRDLMASCLGGSRLSTEIKEPLLENFFLKRGRSLDLVQSQSQKSVLRLAVIFVIEDKEVEGLVFH